MRHHGVTEGYLPSLKFKVKTIQAMGTEQEELEPDPENKTTNGVFYIECFSRTLNFLFIYFFIVNLVQVNAGAIF